MFSKISSALPAAAMAPKRLTGLTAGVVPRSFARSLAALDESLGWPRLSLQGQGSLGKVLGTTPEQLSASEGSFAGHVANANRLLGPAPLRLVTEYHCTRDEIVGLAHAFRQVAARRGFDAQTPEFLSLMVHLLSACELESQEVAEVARFSSQLMDGVRGDKRLQQALAQWNRLAPAQRSAVLNEAAGLVARAFQASGLTPRDMTQDVTLRFTPDLTLAEARAFYGPDHDLSGHTLEFSEDLLHSDPQVLAKALPGLPAGHTCTAGLFMVLASHEFLHVLQHQQQVRRSLLDKATPRDWTQAILYGLCRETESAIIRSGLDTHDGHLTVQPQLPIEKPAWLTTLLVSRLWYRFGYQGHALLPVYLANTAGHYGPLLGIEKAPLPQQKDGVLWKDGRLCLQPQPVDRAAREKQVQLLLESPDKPRPVKASPPARPASR